LFALYNAHPDYEYTASVRNSDKGALVAASFPKIRLVYGTLEDTALLEEESSKADIVIRKVLHPDCFPMKTLINYIDTADASDNKGAAKAIAKGLASGHSVENPGFWLHTSGTGILCWRDMETQTYGEAPSQPGKSRSSEHLILVLGAQYTVLLRNIFQH